MSSAARQLLRLQVHDPVLRKAVTPTSPWAASGFCLPTTIIPPCRRKNTSLIPHGLVEVDGNTVIAANGERHEVDVIIWGTGFDVSHPPIGRKVFNAKGERLSDLWKDSSPEAYLGAALADVPNAFLVLGPNVLVYDSFIVLAEARLDYIIDGLKKIRDRGISRLTIRPSVIEQHNQKVQKHLKGTVFNSGGCKSYYLDQNGRNFAAWPWSLKALKKRLSRFRLKDNEVVYQQQKANPKAAKQCCRKGLNQPLFSFPCYRVFSYSFLAEGVLGVATERVPQHRHQFLKGLGGVSADR